MQCDIFSTEHAYLQQKDFKFIAIYNIANNMFRKHGSLTKVRVVAVTLSYYNQWLTSGSPLGELRAAGCQPQTQHM
jgi:hypothetical protein